MDAHLVSVRPIENGWQLVVETPEAGYHCRADRQGTIIKIQRSDFALVPKQDSAVAKSVPSESGRTLAHRQSSALISSLRGNADARLVAESVSGAILMEYVPMIHGYPVRGYGAIIQFDSSGRFLAYDGNWRLPPSEWHPSRLQPAQMIWEVIDQSDRWPLEFEVAWFEVGSALELLTRVRFGDREEFFRSGFSHAAQREHISPTRYNAGASLSTNVAPSTR